MALANLNINVNTNVSNAVTAITDFKAVANASMFAASQSVDDFQKKAEQTSSAVGVHAQNMGKALDTSSASISRSSAMSSSSISDIGASAGASYGSLNDLNKALAVTGEKAKEQSSTFTDQAKAMGGAAEGYVKNKLEIAAVAVVLGVAAAAVFAFYETLKTGWHILEDTAGFIKGLFTGDSYKSANIDALIATNKEVLTLQESLQMTASDANALNDALQRVGVNKADITDVQGKLEEGKGAGFNSEIDRLGVKTSDSSGNLLADSAIIQNAVAVLDTYTEGWNRNQAAVAIGLGSYAQMTNYLKVNQEEVQRSKDRLNDYNLGVGPETQTAVAAYQLSMLRFNNETRLMGDGFKRVYADMVMPAYTLWADTWAEGWPSIVNGTRHLLAAFVSMGYGIKEVFDIVWDSTAGTLKAIWAAFGGTGAAVQLALAGDFKGAVGAFEAGYQDAGKAISDIGTRITNDSIKNLKAMQLAQGLFNKDKAPAGMAGSGAKDKKDWTPPPDAAKPVSLRSDTSAIDAKWLEYSRAFEERAAGIKINANNLQLEKDKESYDWGLTTYQVYLTNKSKLTLQNISFEKTAKETALKEAQDALKTLGHATDSTGASLPEKDDINRIAALTKIEVAQKALNDVTAKYALAVQTGKNEFDIAARDTIYKIKDVQLATSDMWGRNDPFAMQAENEKRELVAAKDNEDLKTAIKAKGVADRANLQRRDGMDTASIIAGQLGQVAGMMDKSNKDQFIAWKALAMAQAAIATAMAVVGILGNESLSKGIFAIPLAIGAGMIGAAQIGIIAGTQYQGRANGGPVTAGQTYIVNENRSTQGPEYFTPGVSGTITPANKMGGGGVAITQNFSITGVAADLMQNMKTIAVQAKEAAKAEILNSMNRGGEFALASGRMK